MSGLDIVEVGFGTTLQDHGRFGYADLGVPRAGAVDRRAHDLANRLVGNPGGAATIETMRGLVIEARSAAALQRRRLSERGRNLGAVFLRRRARAYHHF